MRFLSLTPRPFQDLGQVTWELTCAPESQIQEEEREALGLPETRCRHPKSRMESVSPVGLR